MNASALWQLLRGLGPSARGYQGNPVLDGFAVVLLVSTIAAEIWLVGQVRYEQAAVERLERLAQEAPDSQARELIPDEGYLAWRWRTYLLAPLPFLALAVLYLWGRWLKFEETSADSRAPAEGSGAAADSGRTSSGDGAQEACREA